MRQVSTRDRGSLSKVLARAFEKDPILRWVVPDDEHYRQFSEQFFQLQLKNSGASYTNDDKSAVALWFGPEDKHSFIGQLISSLKTIWLLKSNLPRAYRLQELMACYRPKKQYLHLTHLATSPEAQGSGMASKLLRPMHERAEAFNTPVYLECTNKQNLNFYRQFGFRLVDDIPVTDQGQQGPTIWPMTLDH